MKRIATPPEKTSQPGPGRPRGFVREEALAAALDVFWRQGYEATSLDDLTEAMGISRSSFYACFGSKRGVLLAALEAYSTAAQERLSALSEETPGAALPVMLESIAIPKESANGCMLVNCITELAPHDPDVTEMGRKHLEALEEVFARALSPDDPAASADTARALVSLAIGTLTLGKSGLPPERIRASLDRATSLLLPAQTEAASLAE
ncbi:TetR/AcrR family transcriptional regulator [Amaricoccus macauensis]|uniref:TetR/AcrR family transcriptional regulator n=1 Tax=Amaricoccus macauensis TaxID=57001 RepID=UPI003C79A0DB